MVPALVGAHPRRAARAPRPERRGDQPGHARRHGVDRRPTSRCRPRMLADADLDAVIVAFLHPLAAPPAEVAASVRRAVDALGRAQAAARQLHGRRRGDGRHHAATSGTSPSSRTRRRPHRRWPVWSSSSSGGPSPPGSRRCSPTPTTRPRARSWTRRYAPTRRGPSSTPTRRRPCSAAYGIAVAPSWTRHARPTRRWTARRRWASRSRSRRRTAAHFALQTPAEVGAGVGGPAPPGPAVVQPMVPAGVDTAIGVSTHPSFGPDAVVRHVGCGRRDLRRPRVARAPAHRLRGRRADPLGQGRAAARRLPRPARRRSRRPA